MRLSVAVAVSCLILTSLSAAELAAAAIKRQTNISPQSLGSALQTLAKDRELQVLYRTEVVGDRRTSGAVGEFTFDEALTQLLQGSNLTFQYLDDKTVTILPVAQASDAQALGLSPQASFRIAQADAPQRTAAPPSGGNSGEAGELKTLMLEEIIVTAQKRPEPLQDVPVPVTAISANALVDNNQFRLQDYYNQIPGLNVSPAVQSAQVLSIRGVTTGSGNPTVGVTVDEVPYGGSTSLGGGLVVPDLDPSNLARVEVLRGPQGTLYGASSMGGLVQFVTLDPSTDGLTGRMQVGASSVRSGEDLGYNVRGSINVPLGDTLAVRASAFTRRDPGYIDDPGLGLEDVNEVDVKGGRVSALWRASDALSVKLSALVQESTGDASSDVFPALGDLEQHYPLAGLGGYERSTQAYSATVNAALGRADFVSLTGYNINEMSDSLDYTHLLGAITPGRFGAGVTATPYFENQETTKFTQELRVSFPLGERVDWLVGAFYTDEDNSWEQRILAVNPTTGAVAGSWVDLAFPTTYEEYALFTNLTFRLTDRFDIQVGGRESENRQTYTETRVGPLVPGGSLLIPERRSEANAFTYLFTPRFKVSDQLMLYARFASGYRAGGPNTSVSSAPDYDPDETLNYELGAKGELLDRLITFDASLYYIDWKDIQLTLVSAAGGYKVNGSRARSQGVELSLSSEPVAGLRVAGWVVWNEAELTEAFAPTINAYGAEGDRLPFAAKFSGNLSVDQEFNLPSNMTGFVGGSVSYISDRLSTFRGLSAGVPLRRQEFPSYARTDVRAGVKYEDWTVNLFVNNVADKRGVIAGGLGAFNPNAFTYIQPRTIGASLTKSF